MIEMTEKFWLAVNLLFMRSPNSPLMAFRPNSLTFSAATAGPPTDTIMMHTVRIRAMNISVPWMKSVVQTAEKPPSRV